jgi:peptide/nickel transport system ATP-binding protein
MPPPLLQIKDLQLEFVSAKGAARVVDGFTLSVAAGETVCLAGESGSGKSVTALSIARLLPSPPVRYAGGEILLDGRDTLKMSPAELRQIRGGLVSYVFQDPANSLNPVFRIGRQIKETLKLHRPGQANDAEVVRLLKLVGLPAPELRRNDYPFQLSGGMQQRVMLANALASQPRLLVADEPTTALDATVQAQILELLAQFKQQFGMAILLITHNLAMVGELADRIAVMYAGQLMELGPAQAVLAQPLHPYTRALLKCAPKLGERKARLETIPGTVPSPGAWPPGCRFSPRCPVGRPDCSQMAPAMLSVMTRHEVRCPYWENSLSATVGAPTATPA